MFTAGAVVLGCSAEGSDCRKILWSGPFLLPSSTAAGRTQSGGLWPCADRNGV